MGCDIHMALEYLEKGALTWRALEPAFMEFLLAECCERKRESKIKYDLNVFSLSNASREFEASWNSAFEVYKEMDAKVTAKVAATEPLSAAYELAQEPEYPYVFAYGQRDYDLFTLLSNVRGESPKEIGNIFIPDEDVCCDYSIPIASELRDNPDYHSPGYATLDRIVSWHAWDKRYPSITFSCPYSAFIKNGKWRKNLKVALTGGPHEEHDELPPPDDIMSPLLFELLCLDKRAGLPMRFTNGLGQKIDTGYPPVDHGFVIMDEKLVDELSVYYRSSWGRPTDVLCRMSPRVIDITPNWFLALVSKLKTACTANNIGYHQLRLVCCYDN